MAGDHTELAVKGKSKNGGKAGKACVFSKGKVEGKGKSLPPAHPKNRANAAELSFVGPEQENGKGKGNLMEKGKSKLRYNAC